MATSPVLPDTTVLTNFAVVNRVDLILDLWGADSATTFSVVSLVMTRQTQGNAQVGEQTY